jgi:hypothetical protein
MGLLSEDGGTVWRHEPPESSGHPAAVMDAASWSAIVGPITTLLGGLGGYALAGRNDDRRDRRAAGRESAARREAFAERLEEDRHTFQRDTLLALQDELRRMVRISARIMMHDEKTLKEQGQITLLPPDMSDEAMEITVAVQRLRSRVLDPELRKAIEEFVSLCNRELGLQYKNAPEQALRRIERQHGALANGYSELVELLGKHLRRELDRTFLVIGPPDKDGQPGGPA